MRKGGLGEKASCTIPLITYDSLIFDFPNHEETPYSRNTLTVILAAHARRGFFISLSYTETMKVHLYTDY